MLARSKNGRRSFLAVAAALSLSVAAPAHADVYPSKTITIVVGFAPGGLIDVIARLVGQKLQIKLGQTVVVENRAGAAGNLAHRRVATAEPDGYTILGGTTRCRSMNLFTRSAATRRTISKLYRLSRPLRK